MAKKVIKEDELRQSENELIQEPEVVETKAIEPEEGEVDAGMEEETQGSVDERILLKRIIVDNPGAPVFAIIRDTLDDEDPERWNSVIRKWISKDYFIVIPPGNDIRDGYLSETGKLYAKTEFNL